MEALRAVNRLDVRGGHVESAPQSGIQIVHRRADGLAGDARLGKANAVEALGQVDKRRVTPSLDVEQHRLCL